MEVVMKYLALLISVIAVLFPGAAATQSTSNGVVVVAKPVTQAQWARNVSRKLDGALRYPSLFSNEIAPPGIVSVRFHAGDDGRPTSLTVERTSGKRKLDRAAMAAIARINTLNPMPVPFRSDQRFVANILFAKDWEQHDQQTAFLRREAAALSAQVRGPTTPIILAVSTRVDVGSR